MELRSPIPPDSGPPRPDVNVRKTLYVLGIGSLMVLTTALTGLLVGALAPKPVADDQNSRPAPSERSSDNGSIQLVNRNLSSLKEESTWSQYRNLDFGISFSHPEGWMCSSSNTVLGTGWYQTSCETQPHEFEDAMVISVPIGFEDEDYETWNVIGTSTLTSEISATIIYKTIVMSEIESAFGYIEYVFATAKGTSSAVLPFGPGTPFNSSEGAQLVGDLVVRSLQIK